MPTLIVLHRGQAIGRYSVEFGVGVIGCVRRFQVWLIETPRATSKIRRPSSSVIVLKFQPRT